MRRLIAIIAILLWASMAWGGMSAPRKLVAAAGGEEPAAGTVLFGATGTMSAGPNMVNDLEFFNSDMPYTATWSESAETTTCSSINVYLRGWAGGNVKGILRGSDEAIIAQTNALNVAYSDNPESRTLTFSSPPTITKGSTYYLSVIVDTEYTAIISQIARTGTNIHEGDVGTYASPATGVNQSSGTAGTDVAIYIRCIK